MCKLANTGSKTVNGPDPVGIKQRPHLTIILFRYFHGKVNLRLTSQPAKKNLEKAILKEIVMILIEITSIKLSI